MGGDKHVLQMGLALAAVVFDSRCDSIHETNTRIARHHIARLTTRRANTITFDCACILLFLSSFVLSEFRRMLLGIVVFPLSRPVVQMQVLQRSALRSIDDYSTSRILQQTLFGVVRQDLYFGPMGPSYQR